MQEYEYSFKVLSIKPYIEYCEKNNYKKKSITFQNRIVYENKHSENIIARMTTKDKDGKKTILFDCKNVEETHKNLKISNESIPMKITKSNRKIIDSILEVLDFYEVANNTRTRYVYEKKGIKFEIDDYVTPKMQVVALEGTKKEVDVIYKELKEQINNIIED